jgi:hypothetical protein
MHKFCKRSRLVAVVKFAKVCTAVTLRVMVDSKTQMSGGLVALLLIREMFAHAQQRNENCGFQSVGMCLYKLLYLPTFRRSDITSSSWSSILGKVPSVAGDYLLVDLV